MKYILIISLVFGLSSFADTSLEPKATNLDDKETLILSRMTSLPGQTFYVPISSTYQKLLVNAQTLMPNHKDEVDKSEVILTFNLAYQYIAGISLREFIAPSWQKVDVNDKQNCLFLNYYKDEELKSGAMIAIYFNAKVDGEKFFLESTIIKPKTRNDILILKNEVCNGLKKPEDFPDKFMIEHFLVKFIKY